MLDEVTKCEKILTDGKENLAKRFRALFTLRNIICPESIQAIAKVLLNDDSDLLKHECAYCLGQMKDPKAIPYLIEAIADERQHPIVRHESGEALGAIGEPTEEILSMLKLYRKHDVRVLAETCDLALERLAWVNNQSKDERKVYEESVNSYKHVYGSVDPTPCYTNEADLKKIKNIYLDEDRSLYERYEALFTLRNMGTPETVETICQGLFGSPSDSVLFKHEVAFVLGQIQSLDSVDALTKKLADVEENEMVRHECAEALGSIGKSDIIRQYLNDKSRIVSESCQVALDMAEYENDSTQFDFIEQGDLK